MTAKTLTAKEEANWRALGDALPLVHRTALATIDALRAELDEMRLVREFAVERTSEKWDLPDDVREEDFVRHFNTWKAGRS